MDPETVITVLSVARRLQALVDNETSDSEKIDQQWKAPYKTALTQLRDAASTEGDPSHHLEKAEPYRAPGRAAARARDVGRALCLHAGDKVLPQRPLRT